MAKQEMKFSGEIGIHYPLHVLNRYLLPELIGLAETTWGTMGQFGFSPSLDQASSRRRFKQCEKLTAKIAASITLRR